jgi:carboxymethylenebutenolidase
LKVWFPPSRSGPAVLILQEIFGVGEYIESVARDVTALGYVAAAPDLFWRVRPGWQGAHTEQGVRESMEVSGQFDPSQGAADSALALRHLADLPEVDGGVAVLGFCLGGTVAFLLAAQTQPAAVVSFYGSRVPAHVDLVGSIKSPTQLQFGGQDPYIPIEEIAKVDEAILGKDNFELHIHPDGGHAFHNRMAPMFYQPEPAARAWELAVEFLRRHHSLAGVGK